MDILEIAEAAIIVQEKTSIASVAAQFMKKKRHEALVFSGSSLRGMLTARDIAKRNITNRTTATIGGLKLAHPVRLFAHDTAGKNIIDAVLANIHVAITNKKKHYTVAEPMLLNLLDNAALKGRTAADAAFSPPMLSPEDSLSVARSLFRDSRAGRLAVVNHSGKADGTIGALNILAASVEQKRTKKGEKAGEKVREDVAASSIMVTTPKMRPDASVRSVVKKMVASRSDTLIVEGAMFQGIITPLSLLRLNRRKTASIQINISGQRGDPFIRSVIEEQMRSEVRKLEKFVSVQHISFHIGSHKTTGKRKKYTVKAKLVTGNGLFVAGDYAWDLTKAVRGVLQKLEREVIKTVEKRRQ